MAKRFRKILVLAIVFTMTFVNYGLPLQAIASEGESIFNFAFFRKNEISLNAYFDDDSSVHEKVLDVNDTAYVTLEVSPLIEGYLKSGILEFNLENGNENNFKIKSVTLEKKEDSEIDSTDSLLLEENKKVTEEVEKVPEGEEPKETSKVEESKVEEPVKTEEKEESSLGDLLKNTISNTLTDTDKSKESEDDTDSKESVNEVVKEEPKQDSEEEIAPEEELQTETEEKPVIEEEAEEVVEEEDPTKGCYEASLISDNQIELRNIIDSTKIFVEVVYKQSEQINAVDLYSDIGITLKGNYINKKLETVEVTRMQDLTFGWEYSKEVEVTSDYVKVSPFTVGEHFGTIVENIVTINRNIEEGNFLPIKETNIKIEIPKINDKLPVAVSVSANKLMATLGKELEGNEFSKDNWSYDEKTGILEIKVSNKEMLAGKGEDKFDIICRYEDYLEDASIKLNKNVLVKVVDYSSNKDKSHEVLVKEEEEQEVTPGELMSYSFVEVEEKINKGKINANYHIEAGYETEYSSTVNLTVLTSDILEEVKIEPTKDTYKLKEGNELDASNDVMYKGVKFSYAEIKDMLEKGTTIDLLDENDVVFHTISKEVSACSIVFSESINNVKVRINDIKANGKISIEFVKVIGKSQYLPAEFEEVASVGTTVKASVKYVGFEDAFQLPEITDEIEFSKSITQVNLLMNKSYLSTVNENENVEFKIDLLNNLETSDLYKNPSFELVFPVYVKEVKINNIYTLYQNGLTIRDYQVVNENGINKVIINLDGIQEGFNFSNITNGTNIILDTNLVLDEITPQKEDEIKLYYCNEAVTNYQSQSSWSILKEIPAGIIRDTNGYESTTFEYQTPTGLIAINGITNYDGDAERIQSFNQGEIIKTIAIKSERRVATMELSVVNNTDTTYTNMILLGRIPFEGNKDIHTGKDLGTNVDTIMKSLIIPENFNSNNSTIYYSSNPNADKDLNKEGNMWMDNINSTELVKSFMIVVDGEMLPGGILKFKYDFEIPENLGYEVKLFGSFGVFGTAFNSIHTSVADKVGLITEAGAKYEATLDVDIGDGNEIGENRFAKYKIKVENTGSIDFNNVKIVFPKPSFAILCSKEMNLDEGNDGYVIRYGTEDVIYSVEGLKVGESIEKEVVVKTDLIPTTIEEYAYNEKSLIFDEETKQYYILNELNEKEFITELPKEYNIEAKATVYVDGAANGIDTNTVSNKLVDSNFNIEITPYRSEGILDFFVSGTDFLYVMKVENISENNYEDVVIEDKLPKELKFVNLETTTDDYEVTYDEENHTVKVLLKKLAKNNSERLFLKCNIANIKNISSVNISNFITVKVNDVEEKSSVINTELIGPELIINHETDREINEVKELEEFDYIFSVNNKGKYRSNSINIQIDVPEELEIRNITFQGDRPLLYQCEENKIIAFSKVLEKNENTSLVVTLKPRVLNEEETNRIFDINAILTEKDIGDIDLEPLRITVLDDPDREMTSEEKEAEEEKNTVKNPEPNATDDEIYENNKESEDNDVVVDTNNDIKDDTNNDIGNDIIEEPENTIPKVESIKTYELKGKVWNDENKNNVKDLEEDGVKAVKVKLYEGDKNLKSIVTDSLGNYRFTEIPAGNYSIIFEYNGNEYVVAKYKLANISERENSDAIESEPGIAITDVISITNQDVEIDLGLQSRDTLDLAVQKFITKAIITTKGKEKVENYDRKELAKLEIRSKELKDTTIKLEYKIVVSNEGNINGKLDKVYDYLPNSLVFDEKENKNWILQDNGVLYNESLRGDVIKPGEKRELKLVLTKVMTEDNTGTISNKVEITGISSDKLSKDILDNNIATQEIIVTISTGRTVSIVLMITILILTTVLIYGIKTGKIKRKYV